MKKFKIPSGIYAITDEKTSRGKKFEEYCKTLLESGVKIIQYREKNKDFGERLKEAKILRELTREYRAIFIVNDSIEIAKLSNADGIHIGQKDSTVQEVRERLGNEIIVGVSVSNEKELERAIEDKADYVGIGPIFNTTTKEDIDEMADISLIEKAQSLSVEYCVIGGIKESNIESLLKKGIKTLCIISDILTSDNIAEKMKRLNTIIKKY